MVWGDKNSIPRYFSSHAMILCESAYSAVFLAFLVVVKVAYWI